MSNQINTGSYAVSTIHYVPWTKKKKTPVKVKKKKPEKKIINEIFQECSKITDDHYWVAILMDCSRGKFPRGFFYKNGMLTHRKGNKINRILIPKEPYEALSITLCFFKKWAGLTSITDRKNMQIAEEKRMLADMRNQDLQWKDITTDKVKELLISEYVMELSNKLNYTTDQSKKFVTMVKSAVLLKYFTSKHIKMSKGKISKIDGLVYNEIENVYIIDPKCIKTPVRQPKPLGIEKRNKKPTVSFSHIWYKYINSINNSKPGVNFRIIDKTTDSNSVSDDFTTSSTSSPISS